MVSEDALARATALLSHDERARSAAIRHPRTRRQYAVSRGMLRQLLSRYAGRPAANLRFDTEGDGKPVLSGEEDWQFNLSHSGDVAVYAIAPTRPVGVDIERLRPVPRAIQLADRYLSPEERSVIVAAPPERRHREFLAFWVQREARAKAEGISIWRALDGKDHTLPGGAPGNVFGVRLVNHSEDYVVAVAASGTDWELVRCGVANLETVEGAS